MLNKFVLAIVTLSLQGCILGLQDTKQADGYLFNSVHDKELYEKVADDDLFENETYFSAAGYPCQRFNSLKEREFVFCQTSNQSWQYVKSLEGHTLNLDQTLVDS